MHFSAFLSKFTFARSQMALKLGKKKKKKSIHHGSSIHARENHLYYLNLTSVTLHLDFGVQPGCILQSPTRLLNYWIPGFCIRVWFNQRRPHTLPLLKSSPQNCNAQPNLEPSTQAEMSEQLHRDPYEQVTALWILVGHYRALCPNYDIDMNV